MKHYWKHAGLTESGAALAESALKPMLRLVAPLGSRELARIVVDEAAYQLWELTTRDPEFQRRYLEDAPEANLFGKG